MKRQRSLSDSSASSSSALSDEEGPPTKYVFVEQPNEQQLELLLSSDEEDYQTSEEDYEDYYDDPLTDDEFDDVEYDSDGSGNDSDPSDDFLAQLGLPMGLPAGLGLPIFTGGTIGSNYPPNLPFGPFASMREFQMRDFFLFTDGFLKSYKGNLEELKQQIDSRNGRVVNNAEAFFRVILLSSMSRRYCEQYEKYKYLMSLGEQKTEEEWKSLCTTDELQLFKTDSKSPMSPSKFQMLNATIYLICTEDEARAATPLFTMVNSFTDFSDLPHANIFAEKGLEAYLNNPRSLMIPRMFKLTNPIPLTKHYAIMAESAEKKEEIRKFLLQNGAPHVIDNVMGPETILDYNSFCVVYSDAIPDIIAHNAETLNYEAISIGITSSFNEFYSYSSVVHAVNSLTNIPHSPFVEKYRPLLLKNIPIKSLVLYYRTHSRKMIPEDQFQQFPTISPSERISTILPNEVFFVILKFLPVNDIMNNFSITCKKARKMSFADYLWKDICLAYASNYPFLKPFTKEENLTRTKLPHYYIFRNIINPILIDYKLVTNYINSVCKEEPDIFKLDVFNNTVTTALYMDRYGIEDSEISVGATKMFGSADLPPCLYNTKYATTPLLLQLNITDLRSKGIGILSLENSPFKHLFPQSGILYFFKDMSTGKSDDGLLLHYDGDLSELKRTNGQELASAVNFYEALCVPKRSEMGWSKSISLASLITPRNRDFMDEFGVDDFVSQLIHAKFIREDVTKLFGELGCFTEGEWYGGFHGGFNDDPDDEISHSRCLDKYVDLRHMLAPIFQLSGKFSMGRRMEAIGFAALVNTNDRHAMWKPLNPNMPNVYTLDECYCSDFFNQVPAKFRKAFKTLIKEFKRAEF